MPIILRVKTAALLRGLWSRQTATFTGLGQKPSRKAGYSHNGVMNPKSFNLYVGKLVNIKALGNVCSENMLKQIKKIFFCEPLVKYIDILEYSNNTILFV